VRNVLSWPSTPKSPTPAGDTAWRDRASELGERLSLLLAAQVGRTGLVLALVGLALGLLFTAQFQSVPLKAASTTESRSEVATTTIHHLEQEQAELKKSIADRRAQVAVQQQSAAGSKVTLVEINTELARQKSLAGMVPLDGRGIKLVLDDSPISRIPSGDDPSLYIIHEYQIRDVVNLLWLSGAEALSINGERFVATTSVYCVGSTILVNDTRLSPPYEILAIGDSVALEGAINDAANLQSIKSRAKSYGIQVLATRAAQLSIPAYTGSLTAKYASIPSRDSVHTPQAASSPANSAQAAPTQTTGGTGP